MPTALRLRVTLRDIEPPIWRLLDLPLDITLDRLHGVLQTAMGWVDYHLHAFRIGEVLYAPPGDEVADQDETGVSVRDLAAFVYLYDWGDGWEHDVEVQGLVETSAVLAVVDGARACPPEDVGGWPGYDQLCEAVTSGARDEWPDDLLSFDPEAFDAAEKTRLLQLTTEPTVRHLRLVGDPQTVEVPPSVRLLLDLLAGGVKLTQTGRLPRSVVQAVQEQRPAWAYWDSRPARTEDDLRPLCDLHSLLRKAGLLRKAKGVIAPTKAAQSDNEIVVRLRAALFASDFTGTLRRFLLERLALAGTAPEKDLVQAAARLMAPGWMDQEGRPVAADRVRTHVAWAGQLLQAVDAVVEEGRILEERWTITEKGLALLS